MENLPAGAENDPNAPWNNEKESTCGYCGDACTKDFCNKDCEKADTHDN